MNQLKALVKERLNGKSSSGGSGGKSSSGGSGGSDVVELTESNFEALVLNSDDMWLVEFFAPWCGHCKNLEPEWKKAAYELKGKVCEYIAGFRHKTQKKLGFWDLVLDLDPNHFKIFLNFYLIFWIQKSFGSTKILNIC